MKYNLLNKNENEGILESIVDSCNGKLIIASTNSFAISSILEELKVAAWSGGYELYNGSSKVNPDVTSDVIIIAVCTKMSYTLPFLDKEFCVATFTRESKDSFTFDIKVSPIDSTPGFEEHFDSEESSVIIDSFQKDDNSEIVNSLRANNVVFVQDLNDEVINSIKNKRQDITEFNSVRLITEGYSIKTDDGIIAIKFDAMDNLTNEYNDCMNFISSALKYGVAILCNTTWIKFFLELSSSEDEVNLSSVVVYNNNSFGPMGNQDLYLNTSE